MTLPTDGVVWGRCNKVTCRAGQVRLGAHQVWLLNSRVCLFLCALGGTRYRKRSSKANPSSKSISKAFSKGDTFWVVSSALRRGQHKTVPGWQPSCDPKGATRTVAVVPAERAMNRVTSNP